MNKLFDNLLRIKLNIEGDSGDLNDIQFNPNMLDINQASSPSSPSSSSINKDGLLISSNTDMSNFVSRNSTNMNNRQRRDDNCNEYSSEITEKLKTNLKKKWSQRVDDELITIIRNSNSQWNNEEDIVNRNIEFLVCLFFKKYEFLTHLTGMSDEKIYLITETKKNKLPGTNKYFKKESGRNIDGVEYKNIYTLTLNLTVLDAFKPAYLKLQIDYSSKSIVSSKSVVFVPSMNDAEVDDLSSTITGGENTQASNKLSMYFSPFIRLDPAYLNTLTDPIERKNVFTDEEKMKKWMKYSFNLNKHFYSWSETLERDIPKENLKLTKEVFLKKKNNLEIEDKEYEIIDSVYRDDALTLKLNKDDPSHFLIETVIKIKLTDVTENELITLAIKLQIDNSLLSVSSAKKINKKLLKVFTPRMVNKNIPTEDNKIFFIPYLEIPPIAELKKLNENVMRLFTVQTEFLKLVLYLKDKNKFQKKFDLKNPDGKDRARLDEIVKKNIQRLVELFLPLNGEIFLEKESLLNAKDPKAITKEEKKFFISKSTFICSSPEEKICYTPSKEVNNVELPFKYTIEIKLELAENKLSMLDFYHLSCREKTKGLDNKLNQVIISAYPSEEASTIPKSTFFTDLMKPDEQTDSLNQIRPALLPPSPSSFFAASGGHHYVYRQQRLIRKKASLIKNNKRKKIDTRKKQILKKNKKIGTRKLNTKRGGIKR